MSDVCLILANLHQVASRDRRETGVVTMMRGIIFSKYNECLDIAFDDVEEEEEAWWVGVYKQIREGLMETPTPSSSF